MNSSSFRAREHDRPESWRRCTVILNVLVFFTLVLVAAIVIVGGGADRRRRSGLRPH